MPGLADAVNDPRFSQLDPAQQLALGAKFDPRISTLSVEQGQALFNKFRTGATVEKPAATAGEPNYATDKRFNTQLSPQEEAQFQTWKKQYAPHDSGDDYDLRGAFKAGLKPDPQSGHWSDQFKKPNHPTFSTSSQYAKLAPEKAGTWKGETYVPPAGSSATPAPTAQPPASATPDSMASRVQRGAGFVGEDITTKPGLLGEAYYELIGRPAADFNAFRYSVSPALGVEPSKFRDERIAAGAPGATRLRTDVPHGWIDNLSAATSPLQAGLLTTGVGRALFGTSVVLRRLKHNDVLADQVEAYGSLGMLGAEGVRAVRGLRGASSRVQEFKGALASSAAGGVTEAATAERAATTTAAHEDLKTRVAQAVGEAQAASATAETAAAENLTRARAAHEAASRTLDSRLAALTPPKTDVERMLGAAGAATPETAGQIAKVGGPAARERLTQTVSAAYRATEEAADRAGLHFSAEGDQSLLNIHEAARDWHAAVATDPRATATERTIANRLYQLGLTGYRVAGTAAELTPEMTHEAVKAGQLNWAQLTPQYRDVPYSEVSKLYAGVANMALTPDQYAVSTHFARREFGRLRGALSSSLRALELGDPETSQLAADARRLVRERQQPFIRQTLRKVLAPSKTPAQAFGVMGSLDDPAHLRRMIAESTEAEGQAYREAWMNRFLEKHTSGADANVEKLVSDWDRTHPEIRGLVSSATNLRVKQGFDELRSRVLVARTAASDVETAKLARAGAKEQLTTTKLRGKQLRGGVAAAGRDALQQSSADVKDALAAFRHSAREAERSAVAVEKIGQQPVRDTVLRASRGRNGTWGLLLGAIGGAQLMEGTPRGIAIGSAHLAMSYLMLKRPRLVAEAFRTPLDTPRGAQIALALRLLLQGWRGTEPAQQQAAPQQAAPGG